MFGNFAVDTALEEILKTVWHTSDPTARRVRRQILHDHPKDHTYFFILVDLVIKHQREQQLYYCRIRRSDYAPPEASWSQRLRVPHQPLQPINKSGRHTFNLETSQYNPNPEGWQTLPPWVLILPHLSSLPFHQGPRMAPTTYTQPQPVSCGQSTWLSWYEIHNICPTITRPESGSRLQPIYVPPCVQWRLCLAYQKRSTP